MDRDGNPEPLYTPNNARTWVSREVIDSSLPASKLNSANKKLLEEGDGACYTPCGTPGCTLPHGHLGLHSFERSTELQSKSAYQLAKDRGEAEEQRRTAFPNLTCMYSYPISDEELYSEHASEERMRDLLESPVVHPSNRELAMQFLEYMWKDTSIQVSDDPEKWITFKAGLHKRTQQTQQKPTSRKREKYETRHLRVRKTVDGKTVEFVKDPLDSIVESHGNYDARFYNFRQRCALPPYECRDDLKQCYGVLRLGLSRLFSKPLSSSQKKMDAERRYTASKMRDMLSITQNRRKPATDVQIRELLATGVIDAEDARDMRTGKPPSTVLKSGTRQSFDDMFYRPGIGQDAGDTYRLLMRERKKLHWECSASPFPGGREFRNHALSAALLTKLRGWRSAHPRPGDVSEADIRFTEEEFESLHLPDFGLKDYVALEDDGDGRDGAAVYCRPKSGSSSHVRSAQAGVKQAMGKKDRDDVEVDYALKMERVRESDAKKRAAEGRRTATEIWNQQPVREVLTFFDAHTDAKVAASKSVFYSLLASAGVPGLPKWRKALSGLYDSALSLWLREGQPSPSSGRSWDDIVTRVQAMLVDATKASPSRMMWNDVGGGAAKQGEWLAKQAGQNAARRLRSVYETGYEFPAWSLVEPDSTRYAGSARVLYHDGDDRSLVQQLVTEREPANVGMVPHYDLSTMQREFGWSTSKYARNPSPRTVLYPNLATYARVALSSSSANGGLKLRGYVHVTNLIGFAFDSVKQPDYQYFVRKGRVDESSLVRAYSRVWWLALQSTRMHIPSAQGRRMTFIGLGADAFRRLIEEQYPNQESFRSSVLRPSLAVAQAEYDRMYPNDPISIVDNPRIPAGIDMSDSATTMYLNAWDPHSIVGNGNESDDSLDGWWGRSTSLAVNCWPLSNPRIKYIPVPPPSGAPTIGKRKTSGTGGQCTIDAESSVVISKRRYCSGPVPPILSINDIKGDSAFSISKPERGVVSDSCVGKVSSLYPYQRLVGGWVTPDNGRNLAVIHGTGTGKTCTMVAIVAAFRRNLLLPVNEWTRIVFVAPNKNLAGFYNTVIQGCGVMETVDQPGASSRSSRLKCESLGIYGYSYAEFANRVMDVGRDKSSGHGDNHPLSGKFPLKGIVRGSGGSNGSGGSGAGQGAQKFLVICDEAHYLLSPEVTAGGDAERKDSETLSKAYSELKRWVTEGSVQVVLFTATLIKREAWEAGKALDLLIKGNGNRIADSKDAFEREYMKPKHGLAKLKKQAAGLISYFDGSSDTSKFPVKIKTRSELKAQKQFMDDKLWSSLQSIPFGYSSDKTLSKFGFVCVPASEEQYVGWGKALCGQVNSNASEIKEQNEKRAQLKQAADKVDNDKREAKDKIRALRGEFSDLYKRIKEMKRNGKTGKRYQNLVSKAEDMKQRIGTYKDEQQGRKVEKQSLKAQRDEKNRELKDCKLPSPVTDLDTGITYMQARLLSGEVFNVDTLIRASNVIYDKFNNKTTSAVVWKEPRFDKLRACEQQDMWEEDDGGDGGDGYGKMNSLVHRCLGKGSDYLRSYLSDPVSGASPKLCALIRNLDHLPGKQFVFTTCPSLGGTASISACLWCDGYVQLSFKPSKKRGLQWTSFGRDPPLRGVEVVNSKLSDALRTGTAFKEEALKEMGVDVNALTDESYVKVKVGHGSDGSDGSDGSEVEYFTTKREWKVDEKASSGSRKRFMVLPTTSNLELLTAMLSYYNSESNAMGDECKVCVAGKSYAQGIDAPSNFVHMVDSPREMATREQAESRGARSCGHRFLDTRWWFTVILYYATTRPDSATHLLTDGEATAHAVEQAREYRLVNDALRESAIDSGMWTALPGNP